MRSHPAPAQEVTQKEGRHQAQGCALRTNVSGWGKGERGLEAGEKLGREHTHRGVGGGMRWGVAEGKLGRQATFEM